MTHIPEVTSVGEAHWSLKKLGGTDVDLCNVFSTDKQAAKNGVIFPYYFQ